METLAFKSPFMADKGHKSAQNLALLNVSFGWKKKQYELYSGAKTQLWFLIYVYLLQLKIADGHKWKL